MLIVILWLLICCVSHSEKISATPDDCALGCPAQDNNSLDTASPSDTASIQQPAERCHWNIEYTLESGFSDALAGSECDLSSSFLLQYTDPRADSEENIKMLKAGFGLFGQAGSCQMIIKILKPLVNW